MINSASFFLWFYVDSFCVVLQFLSDLVHVLEDFKNSDNEESREKLSAQLEAVKGDNKILEGRLTVMESRATNLAKTNSTFLTQVSIVI